MVYNGEINIRILIFSLIILGYFGFRIKNDYKSIKPKRRRYWIIIKALTILCLVLSLSGLSVDFTARSTTTLFLVDSSISVADNKKKIEEYINKQLTFMKSKDKVGVIAFGNDPMVELAVTDDIEDISLTSQPNPYFTDIQEAVSFAVDYFPEKTNKRLVLITDGRENSGNAVEVIDRLKEKKINLEIYNVDNQNESDVQLTSIKVPDNIYKADNIPFELTVDSTFDTKGTFYLYSGNDVLIKKELEVSKGENIFNYNISLNNRKNMDYKGEIAFEKDNNLKNNKVTGRLNIGEMPRALVIGKKEDGQILYSLLKSLDINTLMYNPKEAPDNIEFLSQFNGVFLVNTHHDNISSKFEANLNKCVKELGTGFMAVGGEESFALGGYKNTVLEDMLPVRCKMKGNKKQPNTGLVLVIDSSGSMEDASGGVKKIDMAKEAAIRSIEILQENDYIGVLAFSDILQWIIPLRPTENKEKINKDIEKLGAKGGTLIVPALDEGIKKLQHAPVKIKHLILLSDGQGEKEGYEAYISKMKENNITLSTVAMGQDANLEVLKRLAQETKGRSYLVKDFSSIPKVFAKETYLATKKYINNEEFTPIQLENTEYFERDKLPDLKGYIGTGIKDEAALILKSPLDDPILAQWRYGLGQVIVWTSDLNGKWSDSWIRWEKFQTKWSSIISFMISDKTHERIEVDLNRNKGKIDAFVAIINPKNNERIEMVVKGAGEYKEDISLKQVSTGKYRGSFVLPKEGTYYITAKLVSDNEAIERITKTINLDYSPEYELDTGGGIKTLTELANIADGRLINGGLINKDINVFKQPIRKSKTVMNLSFILLPLALLFYIVDIALRKL